MEDPSVNLTDFIKYEVCGTTFDIACRYSDLQLLKIGDPGVVCSAKDSLAPGLVAIKKISKPFEQPDLAKRASREIRLLRRLKHDNVLPLHDVFISPLEDIYIITELMGTDLEKVISSRRLENKFVQYIFYQIMRGLKYVHSAGIVHRDLNPGNILVNDNCDLKICDFGHARTEDFRMTGYVSKRFYRAPETMLTWQRYDKVIDMWSAGCILAEMIGGAPLFPGRDPSDQFLAIVNVIGSVPEGVIDTICTKNTLEIVKSLPYQQGIGLKAKLPTASPEAIDILEKMLVYDPRARLDTSDALAHPYLSPYHDPDDEPVANESFDWSSEVSDDSVDSLRFEIYSQIMDHLGSSVF